MAREAKQSIEPEQAGLLRRFAPRNDADRLRVIAQGIELMAKGFASTSDMAEKKITFSEIGTDLYAFTAEGDPNSAVVLGDDGCIVFDAQATPAMANKVIERVRTVTDKPIKYVVLSHYHAVRVLGASAYQAQVVIASQE